jgi:feruloyl esterase
MGDTAVAQAVRYYEVPGYGHGNGAFTVSWDSLAALDAWVEQGQAPVAQVAVDTGSSGGGRTRPLCAYPLWPRYNGSGDPAAAAHFTCSP